MPIPSKTCVPKNLCPAAEFFHMAEGDPKVLCRIAVQIRSNTAPLYPPKECDHYSLCDLWRRDKDVTAEHRRKRIRRSLGYTR